MNSSASRQPVANEAFNADASDSGRIKVGGGGRLPIPAPPEVTDTGRIKIGGGGRLPAVHFAG